ncbi:hypothetical protein DSCW_62930 [Desulfosarcina widdelii]|uniref:Uncharacterized protein n=1 Tax=Desulfosarcina widdelii TaxID=947919 RepID=A0A5K7ZAK5_9BACT|nr:hypothetical protein DSCW_62930 [Desulfosarcina widdelii]
MDEGRGTNQNAGIGASELATRKVPRPMNVEHRTSNFELRISILSFLIFEFLLHKRQQMIGISF